MPGHPVVLSELELLQRRYDALLEALTKVLATIDEETNCPDCSYHVCRQRHEVMEATHFGRARFLITNQEEQQ